MIDLAKKKKKKFMRQLAHAYKRIKPEWRKPTGSQSKMRKGKKGRPKMPSIGYKRPEKVRGLHPSGFKEVLIHNVKELEGVNPKEEAIKIASRVGEKKRAEIVKKAEEMNIKVLNP